MTRIVATTASIALLSACASGSDNVSAAYVSPTGYQSLNCEQLVTERSTIKGKIVEVSAAQDEKAGADAAAVAVAAIVFLPAAAFLAAGEDKSGELARLKGEFDAVTQVAAEKDCISAEQLEKERAEAEAARIAHEEEIKKRRAALSSGND